MRLGICTPAPLSMRPTPSTQPAIDALTRHGGGIDQNFQFASEILQRAEQVGFEITLIAQRFLGPDLDSWVHAAALAPMTKTIEIMAAVHPGIMDPRITAKMGASIDRISGGRFCVNIVNGGRPHEFAVYGDWIEQSEPRYRRMREFIQVMRGMWTSDDFNFNGEFYKVAHGNMPTKSVRTPHPPIYAASRVDEGMDVVSRECDLWFVNYDKNFRNYEESLKRIESEIALMEQRTRELGRKMRYGINACLLMADTDAEAIAIADGWMEQLSRDPTIGSASGGIGAAIIGSRKTVLERIRRYTSMGVELFMFQFYPMREGLEVFARELLPELQRDLATRAAPPSLVLA
jgi:FMNH2-dependent dimethyl sulfone monooxygenase